MDISGVVSRPIQKDSSTSIQNDLATRGEGILPLVEPDTISTVKNDWKAKVRGMDAQSRSVQNLITIGQMKQDQLVNIQNELLDYPEKDFASITSKVNDLIDKVEFDGKKLLQDFRITESTSIYDYMARLESTKSDIAVEIQDHARSLKVQLISKENLIAQDTGVTVMDAKVVDDIKGTMASLTKALQIDNANIKDLLG